MFCCSKPKLRIIQYFVAFFKINWLKHTHSTLFSIHLVGFAQQGVWLETGIQTEMKMSLKVLKQTAGGSRECCKGIQEHSCNTVRKAFLFASLFAQRGFSITFITSLHSCLQGWLSKKKWRSGQRCERSNDSSEIETELESLLDFYQFNSMICF